VRPGNQAAGHRLREPAAVERVKARDALRCETGFFFVYEQPVVSAGGPKTRGALQSVPTALGSRFTRFQAPRRDAFI